MKKLLIVIVLALFLCGCSDEYELKKLGYSEEDINLITSLKEENKERFMEEYNEELLSIVKNPEFIENNIDQYLKYRNDFSTENLYYFVNNSIVNDSNLEKLKNICSDNYFIKEKTTVYLEFYDQYDSIRKLVEAVNTLSCYEQYSKEIAADMSKNYLVLVNKFYTLASDYEPSDLVTVDLKYTKYNLQLRKVCYEAYIRMYEDGLKDGMDLSINSAYRSYNLQSWSYSNFCKIDPVEKVDTYSARPGHSEHQTGLAIDIISEGYTFGNFHTSKEAKWLAENCTKYGFILRYPEDKTDVTLYKYEAWQVRYVGEEAEKIAASGLTFDEYYAYYIED